MKSSCQSALFIDGANLYAATKALGADIDYRRLLKEFQSRESLLRAFYYTAVIEDQEYSSIRPLIDWLDYNGFCVVTKPAKEFVDSLGRRKVKGNIDIELAIDALDLAPSISHMILFSGDGDFRSLVKAMQRRGVRVTVVSTIQTQPAMIADELRRQADEFIDLVHLLPRIGRDLGDRNARSQDSRSQESRSQESRSQDTRGPDNRNSAETPTRFRGEATDRSPRPSPALETRYGIRQDEGAPEA